MVTFGKFKGPPDERYKEIFVDGKLVGVIERVVKSTQPGASRAWKHIVTGYTVMLQEADDDDPRFTGRLEYASLKNALDAVKGVL